MTVSSDEWIASWQTRRRRGVLYFLLKWVLGLSIAFILYNVVHWLLGDGPFDMAVVLTKAIFIGLGIGSFVWITNQSKYQRHISAKSVSDT